MPSVSIVLPTFNRLHFLKLTLESVYAQTFSDWELVIADDGSAQETRAYLCSIAGPKVHTIWLAHSGNPSRVRNAAIEVAQGRYLAFLDSDDIWAPSKLEKQIAAMRACPHSRWSYTACDQIDASGRQLPRKSLQGVRPEGWIFDHLLTLKIGIAMPTVVADRELVDAVGRFDEQQLFGEFHDFCLRLAIQSQVVTLRESLCSVRRHGEHYSADKISDSIGWIRLYKKMAALTSSRKLRSHCSRKCGETSLNLVRLRLDDGDYRGAWGMLRQGVAYSWRHPQLWWRILKRTIQLIVANDILSSWRRK
jgi:glycosyltransferase involved in cell wall biosynthesis